MRLRKKTTLPFGIELSSVPLNQELCLNDFESHSHGPEKKKTLFPKKCNCCPSSLTIVYPELVIRGYLKVISTWRKVSYGIFSKSCTYYPKLVTVYCWIYDFNISFAEP